MSLLETRMISQLPMAVSVMATSLFAFQPQDGPMMQAPFSMLPITADIIGQSQPLPLESQRHDGDTDDNAALARAYAKVTDPEDEDNYGRPIFCAPNRGKGVVDPGESIVILPQYRKQQGDWLISDDTLGAGNLVSEITLYGVKGQTRFRKANDGHRAILCCNPEGIGTEEEPDIQSFVYKNITIAGIVFVENVQHLGFLEQFWLLSLNSVENLLLLDLGCFGARGDFIYLGSGFRGDALGGGEGGQVRHNRNVTMQNIDADGGNKNNRNVISVLDCDGLVIRNVTARLFTKRGNSAIPLDVFNPLSGTSMPGIIDIEPNAFTGLHVILRNIWLENISADDCDGANIALLLLANGADRDDPITNIRIINPTTRRTYRGMLATYGDENSVKSYDINIEGGTTYECFRPYELTRGAQVTLTSHLFRDNDLPGSIGYVADQKVNWFTQRKVKYERCGVASGGGAMQIRGGHGWEMDDVEFIDCPPHGVGFIGTNSFADGKFNNVRARNTDPENPVMAKCFALVDYGEGAPVIDAGSVLLTNIPETNVTTGDLQCNGADGFFVPPPSGNWAVDNYVFNRKARAGEPYSYRCSKGGGAPGTAVFDRVDAPGTLAAAPFTVGALPGLAARFGPTFVKKSGNPAAYETVGFSTDGHVNPRVKVTQRQPGTAFLVRLEDSTDNTKYCFFLVENGLIRLNTSTYGYLPQVNPYVQGGDYKLEWIGGNINLLLDNDPITDPGFVASAATKTTILQILTIGAGVTYETFENVP